METSRNLRLRLAHLEDQALAQAVDAEAVRLGALVGAPPDWLVKRASEIAELIERHGYERTLEIVAAGSGLSAERLEARAEELARCAS